ncbi:MAG: Hsp20/alpha crystallin family protein [Gammaproteobacteria bacterium]|nr:Hsp20/alpha crystallin family protein [Gammaproteobacteria bacterium]MDH4253240.1 Hsp20/alpha crystallin family protein [Gammaproteobacteria bacterium]MDH5308981.1 Hsp20/alpha crystallin family protein [Gammaproteobacteria bacterium]
MNITRFEPWGLINQLHRDLDQIATRRLNLGGETDSPVADWIPAVDVIEQKDRFVLRADLPGVRPEDIDVRMEKGILSLAGERYGETDLEVDGMRRIERFSGRFYRRFALPDTADADNISARSTNGILEVTIPKLAEVQTRRITVEAA